MEKKIEVSEELYENASEMLKIYKYSKESTLEFLMKEGLSDEDALIVVEDIIEEQKKQWKEKVEKGMRKNSMIFLIGLLLTGWSFSVNSENGNYYVFSGIIFYGLYLFIFGLVNLNQIKQGKEPYNPYNFVKRN